MDRKPANKKILIIGIDGMDPRATKHYLEEGKLPNVKKLLENGAANENLEMIGGHPTGTPPMWTTLATGCYANVHGITCFNLQSDKGPEYYGYAFDSRKCRAEQLWNVFAENGMKTLVWHWPGSAWPPSSDSPNLHVVDGTQPGGVNQGIGVITQQYFATASKATESVTFKVPGDEGGIAPCAISDLDDNEGNSQESEDTYGVILDPEDGTDGFVKHCDYMYSVSSLKPASGWESAPEDALEFTLLTSGGLLRRPCLAVKNADGVYDTVYVYKNKKDKEPLVILPKDVMVHDILDVDYKGNQKFDTVKSMCLMEIDPDGDNIKIYVSGSMNIHEDRVFSPKYLYQNVIENVGYPADAGMIIAEYGDELYKCMLPMWDKYNQWQSDALHYLIESEDYDVVFSHNHCVDAQLHSFVRHIKHRDYSKYSEETAIDYMEKVYEQTDEYIGTFLHYLDEGWTVFLVSDHALVCPEYERPAFGDPYGVNVGVMRALGFTVMKKDENGNDTHEIDWTKTTAVASRACNIYINLKGRYDHGIVEPEDKYELEEKIMTALYSYKHPISGNRVFALALRNKDAVILGYGGDQCGDIVAWTAEGYNDDHFDAITTTYGRNYTSLMPILIAAGPGIKKGELTERIIRQVDFAPTVAVVGGVRMPKQCEGAVIYQILENEY